MDTGALYRAAALNLWRWGGDPASEFEAVRACNDAGSNLEDPELRSEPVSRIASKISAYPAVREALLQRQRLFAAQAGGAVLDGRDIGTVICPAATAKLFVTASPEVRAERRYLQLSHAGEPVSFEDILADIRKRDERDSHRSAAPLVQAEDAVLLDTSHLSIREAFEAAHAAVEMARSR